MGIFWLHVVTFFCYKMMRVREKVARKICFRRHSESYKLHYFDAEHESSEFTSGAETKQVKPHTSKGSYCLCDLHYLIIESAIHISTIDWGIEGKVLPVLAFKIFKVVMTRCAVSKTQVFINSKFPLTFLSQLQNSIELSQTQMGHLNKKQTAQELLEY